MTGEKNLEALLAAGADAFLQKPFTPEALASSVRELLDMKLTTRTRGDHQPEAGEQSRSVTRS